MKPMRSIAERRDMPDAGHARWLTLGLCAVVVGLLWWGPPTTLLVGVLKLLLAFGLLGVGLAVTGALVKVTGRRVADEVHARRARRLQIRTRLEDRRAGSLSVADEAEGGLSEIEEEARVG